MKKSRINLTLVNITDSQIHVISHDCATSFVGINRISGIDPDELMMHYRNTVKIAKEKGIKVGYTRGLKKKILAISEDYYSALTTYNERFDALIQLWLKKVEAGIYAPTTDDNELNQMTTLEHDLIRMLHRDKPIGKALGIESDVLEALSSVKNRNLYSIRL